jgi:competence ComEA-like helix-hairpin-helix protein
MPTQSEKKALLFVAAVLLLGGVTRAVRHFAHQPSGQKGSSRESLATQIAAVEAARGNKAAGKAPVKSAQIVDVNRASTLQLQALPRVGPVLAARIKAYRDSAGPFASLEQLDRVKGIGPAMLKELAPRVTFSTSQRPRDAPSF